MNKLFNIQYAVTLKRIRMVFLILIFLRCGFVSGADIKVGIARRVITPQSPIYLSGYANREKPAVGILQDLWAKAVVLQDSSSKKFIIVTTDLLGLSHEISEAIAQKIQQKYGINRSQLLLNSSHTHSGPMIWPCLGMIADYTTSEQQIISTYSLGLVDVLVDLIDSAISNLSPMNVFCGHGSADFAINRRVPTDKGIISGVNPNGPVDHDVPVIKIVSGEGVLKAVLFGYACHNTTMVGDNYLVNGDYAGYAQIEIEEAYPGCTAMFMMGCAGDQNPTPRGTVRFAEQHGKSLADAVLKVLKTRMVPVNAPIRCDLKIIDLAYKPVIIETFQKDILGANKFLQRRAKLILEAYNKGWKIDKYPYVVQAVRFGNALTILALSGEVVVDYSLRAKKEYKTENLYVAGYSNEVMCYIPSKRVLQEGGYEADGNMIYYGMPGPFAESIEERIFETIHQVLKNVGVGKRSKMPVKQ